MATKVSASGKKATKGKPAQGKPAKGGAKKDGGAQAKAAGAAPTAAALAAFLGVRITPRLTTPQVRKLLKPLPGYVNVLDDAADQYEIDADVLAASGVSATALRDIKARQRALAKREAVAEQVYVSVYQQRMQVDDEAIGMLRKITRRIAALAEDHPDLRVDWKNVLDFMAQFSPGRPGPSDQPDPSGGQPTDDAAAAKKTQ